MGGCIKSFFIATENNVVAVQPAIPQPTSHVVQKTMPGTIDEDSDDDYCEHIQNNPPQATDYLRNTTSQYDSVNHLKSPMDVRKSRLSVYKRHVRDIKLLTLPMKRHIREMPNEDMYELIIEYDKAMDYILIMYDIENSSGVWSRAAL